MANLPAPPRAVYNMLYITYLNAICRTYRPFIDDAYYAPTCYDFIIYTLKMRIGNRVMCSGRNSANRSNYRTHTASIAV